MNYAERFKSKSPFKIGKVTYQGEDYFLREMSVGQKMKLMDAFNIADGESNVGKYYDYFSHVVVSSLCDEGGVLATDVDDSVLDFIPSGLMDLLVKKVIEINNLSKESQEQLKNE